VNNQNQNHWLFDNVQSLFLDLSDLQSNAETETDTNTNMINPNPNPHWSKSVKKIRCLNNKEYLSDQNFDLLLTQLPYFENVIELKVGVYINEDAFFEIECTRPQFQQITRFLLNNVNLQCIENFSYDGHFCYFDVLFTQIISKFENINRLDLSPGRLRKVDANININIPESELINLNFNQIFKNLKYLNIGDFFFGGWQDSISDTDYVKYFQFFRRTIDASQENNNLKLICAQNGNISIPVLFDGCVSYLPKMKHIEVCTHISQILLLFDCIRRGLSSLKKYQSQPQSTQKNPKFDLIFKHVDHIICH
jgi:hypothetical protein